MPLPLSLVSNPEIPMRCISILSFPCRVESIYLPYIVLAVFYRPPLYAAINQVIITLLNAGLYAVPENICYFCP